MNGEVQYISSMGELVRKDNTLQFRNNEKQTSKLEVCFLFVKCMSSF